MTDKWEFYKDNQEQWRWRRTAPNGNIVGASTEGYVNKADCLGNAQRNGWETDEMLAQELTEENDQIEIRANALYEKHGFKGGDEFAAGFVLERKKEELYQQKHHRMQRNYLLTIVLLLLVIIALLCLTFFKESPRAESPIVHLSDSTIDRLSSMMIVPDRGIIERVIVLDPADDEKLILLGETHFDFNKSSLNPEAKVRLDKDVIVLKENPAVHVRMAGYTSARGTDESNQRLSVERANAVRDYLIKKGIAPERITVIGYGRTRPALYEADPSDVDSREAQANRRVLFEITAG